jgi:3-hydroxyisobutyrate dehydrogenase-like beta-hydroxyacid dehydrogenase
MFALRDLRKDLDLALSTFHRVDAHVPITALVREWVDEAAAADAEVDISAVIRRYAQSHGSGPPLPQVQREAGHSR